MHNDSLDKPIRDFISILPACIGAILGWLGINLSKENPKMNGRQVVGGIILCGFTGGILSIFLTHTGWEPTMASLTASVIGSSGARGYEFISMKILRLFER